MQCATSLSNDLQMGKHNVLQIFLTKSTQVLVIAGAVLKGTAGHRMWARGKSPPTMT